MKNENIERLYVKPETEKYYKKRFTDHWERYEFAATFCRQGNCVVDVACASGFGTHLLSKKVGKTCVGLDIDSSSVEWAQKYYGDNSKFFVITDGLFPLEDEVADVVISLETIEHVKKPQLFLAEVRRVLKKEGVFIVSTPLNETATRFNPENEYHIREYSWAEFDLLLQDFFIPQSRFSQISNIGACNEMISKSRFSFIKNLVPRSLRKKLVNAFLSFSNAKTGSILEGYVPAANVQLRVVTKK